MKKIIIGVIALSLIGVGVAKSAGARDNPCERWTSFVKIENCRNLTPNFVEGLLGGVGDKVQIDGTLNPTINNFTGTVLAEDGQNVLIDLDIVPDNYEFPENTGDKITKEQWFAKEYVKPIK